MVELDDDYNLTENMTLLLQFVVYVSFSEDSGPANDSNDNNNTAQPEVEVERLPGLSRGGSMEAEGAHSTSHTTAYAQFEVEVERPPGSSRGGSMEAEGVCEGMLLDLSQGSADGESANQHKIHNVLQLRGGGESSEEEERSDDESSEEEE
ncbi:MAG: hypothetical protein ACKPKO_41015, partial [Candidatus Fonsibacter sp.]